MSAQDLESVVEMSAEGNSDSNHGTAVNLNSNLETIPPEGRSSNSTEKDDNKDNTSIKSFFSNFYNRFGAKIPYKKMTTDTLSTQNSLMSAIQNIPLEILLSPNLKEDVDQIASPNLEHLYKCLTCENVSKDSLQDFLDHPTEDRTTMSEKKVSAPDNGQYLCKRCDYKTSWKLNHWWHCRTKDHMKRVTYAGHVEEKKTERSSAHQTDFESRCNVCNEYFTSIEELKLHSFEPHHSIRASLFNYIHNYDEENNPFQGTYYCVLCEFQCRDEFQMVQHVRSFVHLENERNKILLMSSSKFVDEEGRYKFKEIFKASLLCLNAPEQDPTDICVPSISRESYVTDICGPIFQRNPAWFQEKKSRFTLSSKRKRIYAIASSSKTSLNIGKSNVQRTEAKQSSIAEDSEKKMVPSNSDPANQVAPTKSDMNAGGNSNSDHEAAGNSKSNCETIPPAGRSSNLTDKDDNENNSSVRTFSLPMTTDILSTENSLISANQPASQNHEHLYKCLVCNHFSKDLEDLLDHLTKDRTKMIDGNVWKNVNGQLECRFCKYKTSWKLNCWWHCATKDHVMLVEYVNHRSEKNTGRSSDSTQKIIGNFDSRCTVCNQCFTSIEQLKIHSVEPQHRIRVSLFSYMRNYNNKGKNPLQRTYYCVICEFKCGDEFEMVQHARSFVHLENENKTLLMPSSKFVDKEGSYVFKEIFKASLLRPNAPEQDPDLIHGQPREYQGYLTDICGQAFRWNKGKIPKEMPRPTFLSEPVPLHSRMLPDIPTSATQGRSTKANSSPGDSSMSPDKSSSSEEGNFQLSPLPRRHNIPLQNILDTIPPVADSRRPSYKIPRRRGKNFVVGKLRLSEGKLGRLNIIFPS